MDFRISENISNLSIIDKTRNTALNFLGGLVILLGIFLLPFLLLWMFFQKVFKPKIVSSKVENKWDEFFKSENIKLYRKFINENDLPDDMDIPEECNDIYAFDIKSEPRIKSLENIVFDYQYIETDYGVYLISFNKVGEQMSLWFIDKTSLEIKIVKKLKSMWWTLSKNENIIILKATEKNKDYFIEIEEIKHNTIIK